MRYRLNKRAGFIVLTVSIGAIVLAVWFFFAGQRRSETQSAPGSVEEIDQVARINDKTLSIYDHSNGDSMTTSVKDSFDISLDLVAACPDPSADLSDQCVATLDAVYAKKMMGRLYLDWINFDLPLNNSRIFMDPVRDREKVLEALNNPNCNLSDEDDIRWDLYDECDADAFANFYHFTRRCRHPDRYDNRYDYWFGEWYVKVDGVWTSRFEAEKSWIVEDTPEDGRDRRTRQLWEKVLETRWVVKECERFNVEKILIDPSRDQNFLKKLLSVGKILKVNDQIDLEYEIMESLRAIAAQFGDEWAVITHDGSPAWRAFRAEQQPWIQTNRKLFQRDATRESKLLAGVQIALELADSDLEFDWDFLVSHICTDQRNSDPTSCQTAINKLYSSFDALEDDELQILVQIERVALKLGVYSPTLGHE